ncbi:hypothetical protein [Salibacter halophilus]|uniref:WG repeat-containing protein n=1 Tax=Salibacter halophilus TaxID=1803916 RepID=A0A6N6MD97_9FLAO|nr:hypothetical protein [Salibacter halophilus]KAB1065559.1 hypothetical protein F3059_02595 [Salibacter halophilus]
MRNKTILSVIVLSLLSLVLKSQDVSYYDEETNTMIDITPDLPQEKLTEYLKVNELEEIEFNPNKSSQYNFRVQNKSGDWLLFNFSTQDFFAKKKYSFEFPQKELEKIGLTTVLFKGDKYLYSLAREEVIDYVSFEEMSLHGVKDTNYVFDNSTQTTVEQMNTEYLAALKRKQDWALYYLNSDPYEKSAYQLTPFNFNNKDDLPYSSVEHYIKKQDYYMDVGFSNPVTTLDKLLTSEEYINIEYNTSSSKSSYPFRLKTKKDDWVLCSNEGIIDNLKGYSFEFPKLQCGDFTIVNHKRKKYLYSLSPEGGGLIEKIEFDRLKPHYRFDHVYYEDPDGKLIQDTIKNCEFILLEKDKRWALAYFSNKENELYQLSGFNFSNKSSSDRTLNSLIRNYYTEGIDEEFMGFISNFLIENPSIDIALPFGYHDYTDSEFHPVLQVRHNETKRWSISIQGAFRSETEFPIAADSIISHEFGESKVLEVWCGSQVGYYIYKDSDFKKLQPCEFDDFEYLSLDYTDGCALRKNGKWGLYKADASEKIIDSEAETIEELIDLWLDR